MALYLTDGNFDSTVQQSQVPVMVDFWAEWSEPCRMIGPLIEELDMQYQGRAVIAKLNVDMSPDTTVKNNIQSVPTLLFFKNGQLRDTIKGLATLTQMRAKIDALM